MTSTLARGVGRRPGETARPLRALDAGPAIIVLLLGALALRLTIAYVLLPSSGFETDLRSFASWALTLAEHGPGGFYESTAFSDYPPGYLYLLWPLGLLARQSADPVAAALGMVKLPPILLDLAVGYVIYRLVLGWAWPGRRAEAMALAAAALYLFNPISLYDSALWGQADAAGALVLLLGAAALIRGNSEGAAMLAASAALVKPQFGVVLIPLVGAVLVKRHLLRPGSGPRSRPWAPRWLAAWLASRQGPVRLVTSLIAATAAFLVLAVPFAMGPLELLERVAVAAGGYPYLTVNAFNAWSLLGSGGTPSLAEAPLSWSDDRLALFGPVPGVAVGAGLLVAGFLWGSARAAIRDDRWTLLVALTFLVIAFFILPTRVHERYLFPAVALMPILAVVSRRWAVALLLLSVGMLINLHAVLTVPNYGTDNVISLPLGASFRSQPWVIISVALQTGVGLWAAWQLRPSLRTTPDGFTLASRPMPSPMGTFAPPAMPGPAYPGAPAPDVSHAWVRGPTALDWIVARLSRPSLRADRSAALATERGGRLDRADALLVAGLVLVALTVRGYRLDEPVGPYFDEVYHARTATEFLQHWEYGKPHAIYEFTHPHLAKYAMAWGIRLAGGNEVTGRSALGVSVEDALIERAWSAAGSPDRRQGDRLWVATGETLRAYDLAELELASQMSVPATALGSDAEEHRLYLAGPTGRLFVLDTATVGDERDSRGGETVPSGTGEPVELGPGPGAPVDRLVVTGSSLVAIGAGFVATFDSATGQPLSERFALAVSDAVELPAVDRVMVDTRLVPDRPALARRLVREISGAAEPDASEAVSGQAGSPLRAEAERIGALLEAEGIVVADAYLDDEALTRLREAIDSGSLPGVSVERGPLLALAGHDGITIVDAWTLDLIEELTTEAPVTSLILVEGIHDEPTLYAAAGDRLQAVPLEDDGPGLTRSLVMPGRIGSLAWNEPSGLIHAAGVAPEGGPTVYVVEPHGESVFADVPISVEPARLLADTQPQRPADDRGRLLALAEDGDLTGVRIDGNAFGWRLPGLLMGALGAGLLYLLARVLFARRSVGVLAAALMVAEGMLFANSRIGMNDVYVTTFIIAAALLFAPLYLAPRRPWVAVLLLLGCGLTLGLALSSKWVALYAMGGLALLVLLRSGLGRLLALAGMVTLTATLGALALRPSATGDAGRDWVFLALMLVLTGLLTAGIVRRPLPISSRADVRLATSGLMAFGLVLVAMVQLMAPMSDLVRQSLLVAGTAAVLAALAIGLLAWLAGRRGRGPLASGAGPPRTDGGTSGWLRPDWLGGLPWLFTLTCLTVLPLVVYIVSYAPWIELGNRWGLPLVGSLPFLPPGEGTGQSLADLTASMYRYHDNLRAAHAASSPWWAWPLDLKPVWFFSERYVESATGLIYDTGNLVILWLGIAGAGFTSWAAWRRGSLSLMLVVILWATLWLPWARIDRATFGYHFYASLPFLILGLAYLLAELWHGPSPGAWFLARLAGALAILAVPLLWLLRTPLCILAGTAVAHPDGVACASTVTRTAQVSQAGMAALVVAALGVGAAASLSWRASRARSAVMLAPDGAWPWSAARGSGDRGTILLVEVALVGLATIVGMAAALLLLDSTHTVAVTLSSDTLALLGLLFAAVPAALVLRARDPRRYVLAAVAAAVLWLVIWYPNLAGLPMPSDLAHLYQGVLPTWNWDFQFAVETDPAMGGASVDVGTLVVGSVTLVLVMGVAAAAWLWGRSASHERQGATEVSGEPASGGIGRRPHR